jgi:hypothetical protein
VRCGVSCGREKNHNQARPVKDIAVFL